MDIKEIKEEIKKEIINHASKKIEIVYEPGKTEMTCQDKQLLDSYIRLHDFECEMGQIVDNLFHEFVPVNKKLNELRKDFLEAKATFDKCRVLADKLSGLSYDPKETNLAKLIAGQEKTSNQLLPYSEKITEVYNNIKALTARMDEYYVRNEDEANALYDEFSALNAAHSANWEHNSINIVIFDREYDNFLSSRGVMEDRRDSLLDYCNTTINDYTALSLESNGLFEVGQIF